MRHRQAIEEISAILVRRHRIPFTEIQELRKTFNSQEELSFEEFILDQGIISKSDLLQALGEYYRVTAIDVIGEFFDHYLVTLFPKDILLLHYFIPYSREGDLLTVIAADPSDPHLAVVIGQYISHNINFMVGMANDIHEAIEEFYDRSDTYQPNDISNEKMERSAVEVNPLDQVHHPYGDYNKRIPLVIEETNDDYESH